MVGLAKARPNYSINVIPALQLEIRTHTKVHKLEFPSMSMATVENENNYTI